ncbi:MAG: hypothetical protein NTW62_01880 [Candidatus Nomurabacteria bacterium]|nr:hypothetical protein [Candidatus Nomurabacteria bacterium]
MAQLEILGTTVSNKKRTTDVPKTITPLSVIALHVIIWVLLIILLKVKLVLFGITGVAYGVLIFTGVLAETVKDWKYTVTFNTFTKRRRVLFAGFHFLGIETVETSKSQKIFDSLKTVMPLSANIPLTTNDSNIEMNAQFSGTMWIDTEGTADEVTENVIKSKKFESQEKMVELFSDMIEGVFSTYYSKHPSSHLVDEEAVIKGVFFGPNSTGLKILNEFQEANGVGIKFTLKDSSLSSESKKIKLPKTRAEAFAEAVKIIMKKTGMSIEEATKVAKLQDPNQEYTENEQTSNFKFTGAPEGMHTFIGTGGSFGAGAGKK